MCSFISRDSAAHSTSISLKLGLHTGKALYNIVVSNDFESNDFIVRLCSNLYKLYICVFYFDYSYFLSLQGLD